MPRRCLPIPESSTTGMPPVPGTGGRGFHRYRRLTEQGFPRGRPLVRLRAPQCVHGIVDGSAPPLHLLPTGAIEINAKRGDASAWVRSARNFVEVPIDLMLERLSTRLQMGTRRRLPAGRCRPSCLRATVADMMIYLGWSMAGAARKARPLSAPGDGTRVGAVD